ncbi:DUF6506 family protein [Pseudooceanicola sp. MF1-13]|uniref:DUF6506 family protein n=1 Tax=Pseudooceanicola sp. MF1-13 TaxID=3379095 RepID=UPI003891AC65
MPLTHFGFIATGPGMRPDIHRSDISVPGYRMTVVCVPTVDEAPQVAKAMALDGVELIELCGAFGPAATAAVATAIGPKVALGVVTYPGASATAMHRIFSPDPPAEARAGS